MSGKHDKARIAPLKRIRAVCATLAKRRKPPFYKKNAAKERRLAFLGGFLSFSVFKIYSALSSGLMRPLSELRRRSYRMPNASLPYPQSLRRRILQSVQYDSSARPVPHG